MADLGYLRSELNFWNSQASALRQKIEKLNRRSKDVKNIKSALNTEASRNAGEVNGRLWSAAQKLESGIEHSAKDSWLDAIFAGKNEQTVGADPNLTFADRDLQREIDNIDCQLAEANANLSKAQNNAGNCRNAIAAEESRQREEQERRAREAAEANRRASKK